MSDTTNIQPVKLFVTEKLGAREFPSDQLEGHLMCAVLDLTHRLACEAYRGFWASAPRSHEFMETETGLKGWRAHMSQETAHLVHVLESEGIAEFTEQ